MKGSTAFGTDPGDDPTIVIVQCNWFFFNTAITEKLVFGGG